MGCPCRSSCLKSDPVNWAASLWLLRCGLRAFVGKRAPPEHGGVRGAHERAKCQPRCSPGSAHKACANMSKLKLRTNTEPNNESDVVLHGDSKSPELSHQSSAPTSGRLGVLPHLSEISVPILRRTCAVAPARPTVCKDAACSGRHSPCALGGVPGAYLGAI